MARLFRVKVGGRQKKLRGGSIIIPISIFRFIFAACGMAGGALFQFGGTDAFFTMIFFHVSLFVFVAIVTGVLIKSNRMAGGAGNFAFIAVRQGEGMLQEAGRLPGNGGVAGGAIQAKKAGM